MLSFFPQDVLDEIWDLIESVSEGFLPTLISWADFSDLFRNIIIRYKRIGYNVNVMRQFAYLVVNSITLLPSVMHFGWSCVRLGDGPNHKAVLCNWFGLDLALSVA